MDNKELLTKNFMIIDANEVGISTEEKNIIGTQNLSTSVGILIYSEKHKKAIVAHITDNIINSINTIIEIISTNNLQDEPLKYKIIEGYYYNNYQLKERIKKILSSLNPLLIPFDKEYIDKNEININLKLKTHEFAFDSLTGKFVSSKVYFGQQYYEINQSAQKK